MLLLAFGLTASGCGPAASTSPPPRRGQAMAPSDNRIKLAVLPVESDAFPRAAAAINDLLRDVHVRGVDDYFMSKVALEVVQLSIECVEQTTACYSAVGKSLTAQRLLLAQIAPAGTRKRDKSLRVTITLFDVDAGAAANVADRTYKNEVEAMQGVSELLDQAVKPRASSARAAK
ncbi:MAG TPA: hypothetical protein VFF06_02450 [Polyangia bacterium]|nr:hypothetical protein [Polyangia bacterium]